MLKKVKITVSSVICDIDGRGFPEGNVERGVESAEGTLRLQGSELSISYKTNSESGEITTQYRIAGNTMTLTRRGALSSDMVFEEGATHTSIYEIPPYKFDMSLKTRKLSAVIGEKGGKIRLIYEMTVGESTRLSEVTVTVSEV